VIGDPAGNLFVYTVNGPIGKEERIILLISSDEGANWEEVEVENRETRRGTPTEARLVTGKGGRAYFTWLTPKDDGGREVMFSRTLDGGRTWSQPVALSQGRRRVLSEPALSSAGDWLGVTWVERGGDESLICFTYSVDGGQTWKPDHEVYRNRVSMITPRNIFTGDNFLVTWYDHRDRVGEKGERLFYNLYSRRSGWLVKDPVSRPGEIEPLLNLKKYLGMDSVAAGKAGVAMTFSQKFPEKRSQIYFSVTGDPAKGFETPLQVSSSKSGVDSLSPRLCRLTDSEFGVLYNEVAAQLYPGQPRNWLGDLVLARIHARLK
jgi:hypothetical protein